MKIVALEPLHSTVAISTGCDLTEALLRNEVKVALSCGGNGFCATCHVLIREGKEQLSPMTERERRTLTTITGVNSDSRLACQARVLGDGVVVQLPPGMYVEHPDDVSHLIGSRAKEDLLHPVNGSVLIPAGTLITRSRLEQLKLAHAQTQKRTRE